MRVEIKFSTTWVEYEAYQDATFTEVLHKGLAPADNEARVTFYQNTALYNLLRAMTTGQKVPVRIYDDADAIVFYGYIDRNFSVRKKQRLQPIQIQLVSPSNYLRRLIPETLSFASMPISAASSSTTSFIRTLLTHAGYTSSEISIPDILTEIPPHVIEENTKEYFDVIKKAMFDGGYIFDFDNAGVTTYYELFPSSVSASTHTFNGTNSRIEIVQQIKKEEYDGVNVTYPEIELVEDCILFKDNSSPNGLFDCNIELPPETYLNGEEFWYAEYDTELGTVLSASNINLDINKDSQISVEEFTGYASRARLSIYNTSAAVQGVIRRLRITGDATIQTGVNVIKRRHGAGSENIFDYTSEYLSEKSAAESLANKLSSYFKVSDFNYSVISEDKVALGSIVTVDESGIGTNVCRVIQRKTNMRGAYEYVLEAIADYIAPVVSESEKIIPQAPGNVGVIDQLVEELEARPTTDALSTAPATPASLVAVAGQDGFTITATPGGTPGLENSTAYYKYEISRNGGSTYLTVFDGTAQASYIFDRDIDGWPDAMTNYRIRAKAVSIAGVESVAYVTGTIDASRYLGWAPTVPTLSVKIENRTATLKLGNAGYYYGHTYYEVQIQKDGDGSNWYALGDSSAARTSETSYRGTLGGTTPVYGDTISQVLPLTNQSVNLPEDTTYLYRARAFVAGPDTEGTYSSAVAAIAKPQGTVDVVAGAIKTAQLDKSAVTIEKLNVLAKNLVNDLTDDADGTMGWTVSSGGSWGRVSDTSLTPDYKVASLPSGAAVAIYSSEFVVGPNDIIEVTMAARANGTSATCRMRLGAFTETYATSTWDATAKTWGAFGGVTPLNIIHGASAAVGGTYKSVKSYIVGTNVTPDMIPAPVNDLTSTTICAKSLTGVGRISVVRESGDALYFFAPSARKVGSGKIVAQQIVTPNLSAISANLGEITGDTADYKLVMGSGGSAEEGTLLLGATTDASYFRRWKEGGVWKMAIKLATLFVDAVSSKILGIFRVRNSADTATVFEVDPAGSITCGRPLRFTDTIVTSNTGSTSTQCTKIGTITLTARYLDATARLAISATEGGSAMNSHHDVYIRVKQQSEFGSNPVIEAWQNYNTSSSVFSLFYHIVSNAGPTVVDIYAIISPTFTILRAAVIKDSSFISWLSHQGFVSLPVSAVSFARKKVVIEDVATSTTALANVTASSLAVSGPATLAAADVTLSADLKASSKKITGLADGTADADAINRGQLDARFMPDGWPVLMGPVGSAYKKVYIGVNDLITGSDNMSMCPAGNNGVVVAAEDGTDVALTYLRWENGANGYGWYAIDVSGIAITDKPDICFLRETASLIECVLTVNDRSGINNDSAIVCIVQINKSTDIISVDSVGVFDVTLADLARVCKISDTEVVFAAKWGTSWNLKDCTYNGSAFTVRSTYSAGTGLGTRMRMSMITSRDVGTPYFCTLSYTGSLQAYTVGSTGTITTVGSAISIGAAANNGDVCAIDKYNNNENKIINMVCVINDDKWLRTYEFTSGTGFTQAETGAILSLSGVMTIAALSGTDITVMSEASRSILLYRSQ